MPWAITQTACAQDKFFSASLRISGAQASFLKHLK
jgi:hypothetical protein